jgi:membrane-associated phospholipid phosphatase
VLVFASVLLVKQHFFADVLGGIAVLELGLFLSKRLRAWRIYDRLIPKESAA